MATLGTHIPQEITEYREKIIGGFTLRQLAGGCAALLMGALTFLLCHTVFGLNAEQSSYFIMASAIIPGAIGFIRPMNMDFEKYILMRYRHRKRSKSISYKTTMRGDTTYAPVHKAKDSIEYTQPYYRYSRRRERRIIRQTRKRIRCARKEIRKAQKDFRRQERIRLRAEKHEGLPAVRQDAGGRRV